MRKETRQKEKGEEMTSAEVWGGVAGLCSSVVIGGLAVLGINKKIDQKVDMSACNECRKRTEDHFSYVKESMERFERKLDNHLENNGKQ